MHAPFFAQHTVKKADLGRFPILGPRIHLYTRNKIHNLTLSGAGMLHFVIGVVCLVMSANLVGMEKKESPKTQKTSTVLHTPAVPVQQQQVRLRTRVSVLRRHEPQPAVQQPLEYTTVCCTCCCAITIGYLTMHFKQKTQ